MKVRMTWDFNDDDRRAIARQTGQEGKASHADCLLWMEQAVEYCLIEIAVPSSEDQAIMDAQARDGENKNEGSV